MEVVVTKSSTAPLVDNSAPADVSHQSSQSPMNSSSSQVQTVLVTDSCWKRIHQLLAVKQTNGESTGSSNLFLRVFVDAGGCSGFTYQFEMDNDTNLQDDDVVFVETTPAASPARVVIDRGSLQFIAGSKIDYVQEMIKSSFEVRDNPQSESACGCGSSFALKNFASNPALD